MFVFFVRAVKARLPSSGIHSDPVGPTMNLPMVPVVTKRRQLAPTVGPAAALARVYIRTGSIISSGERVVCGLAQQFGSLCFVDDNAGCFGSNPLPASGRIICFGAHQVFVATELLRVYPAMVHVAEDPPSVRSVRGRGIAPSADRKSTRLNSSHSGESRMPSSA